MHVKPWGSIYPPWDNPTMPCDLSRKTKCLEQQGHHQGPSYQSGYLTQILSQSKVQLYY